MTPQPRKLRGIAIFPPVGVAVHVRPGVDPETVRFPEPPPRQDAERSAGIRSEERARRDRLIRPLQCRGGRGPNAGPRCRLRIAALIWSEDTPRRAVLAIRGPWARDNADQDPGSSRFILTGDPIPGTDMLLVLQAIPSGTKVTIRCSCGRLNELDVDNLQEVAKMVGHSSHEAADE